MRDYGKLSPFFWTRGSGKRLRGDPAAQVVAAYLSTSPAANMVGIYYVSIATVAHDTGLDVDQVHAALQRVAAARYAFYDSEAELVWIPNHARFEIGPDMKPGDKRRPKMLAELKQHDGHRFVAEFRARYGDSYGLPGADQEGAKGHPLPDPKPDGASGDLPQDRAGSGQDPDRTGQGQARERAREPTPIVQKLRPETIPPEYQAAADAELLATPEQVDVPFEWRKYLVDRPEKGLPFTVGDWQRWVQKAIEFAKRQRMRESERREREAARASERRPSGPEVRYPMARRPDDSDAATPEQHKAFAAELQRRLEAAS